MQTRGDDDSKITYFGATHLRNRREMFGIRGKDRAHHMFILGRIGMGKTTLLENMAIQDIQNGNGLMFIDPYGTVAERLLDFVPYDRIDDVVYWSPADTDFPFGLNVFEGVPYGARTGLSGLIMMCLKRVWADAWGPEFELILRHAIIALFEYPGATMMDIVPLLQDESFRKNLITHITDPIIRKFWEEDYAHIAGKKVSGEALSAAANSTQTKWQEAVLKIRQKVELYTSQMMVRNVVGQQSSTFDLREMMDSRKIFIVNIAGALIGGIKGTFFASLLTAQLLRVMDGRGGEREEYKKTLPRFYIYIDEYQSLVLPGIGDSSEDGLQSKVAFTVASQYMKDSDDMLQASMAGRIGTVISFQLGVKDAGSMAKFFDPSFTAVDLTHIGKGHMLLRMMIDGHPSSAFSADTIPPIEPPRLSYREDIIARTRAKYARPKANVEREIQERYASVVVPPAAELSAAPEAKPDTKEESPEDHRRALREAIEKARAVGLGTQSESEALSPLEQLRRKRTEQEEQKKEEDDDEISTDLLRKILEEDYDEDIDDDAHDAENVHS